ELARRLTAFPQATQVFRGSLPIATDESSTPLADVVRRARFAHKADWGLGMVVNLKAEAGQIEIAVIGEEYSDSGSLGDGGPPALAMTWAGTAALNLLRLKL